MPDPDPPAKTAPHGSASSELLEQLPLHSTDLLTLLDSNGVVRYESPAIERLYGYDQEELVGEQVAEYFHPDDRPQVMNAFQALIEADGHHVESVEYRHLMADGSYRWIESVGSSKPTPDGTYVINSRDISERKQRERALQDAKQRIQSERDGKEAVRALLLESTVADGVSETACQVLVDMHGYDAAWLVSRATDDPGKTDSPVTVASHGDDRGFRSDGRGEQEIDPVSQEALSTGEPVSICLDPTETAKAEADRKSNQTIDRDGEASIRQRLTDSGLNIVRSIPLEYDGITDGVLTVARAPPETEFRRDLVSEFAEAIAFKRQSARRQSALVTGSVVECTIRLTGGHFLSGLSANLPDGTQLAVQELDRTETGATYVLETDAVDGEILARTANGIDAVNETVTVTADRPAIIRCHAKGTTLGSVLSGYGVVIQSITAYDGVVDARLWFPRLTDINQVADTLDDHLETVSIRSQRVTSVQHDRPAAFDSLTESQERALRAATVAGFFDRPQGATAAEVAETLDISRSTFLHHLRNAEQAVFEDAFGL